MKVVLIAAIGRSNELGKDNGLLWHLGSDMEFFKQSTLDHWVIMGRKSFESLPAKFRPLPRRTNVIITRDVHYHAEGCPIFHSLSEAIASAEEQGQTQVFVIGGAQIYAAGLEEGQIDEMLLTHVNANFPEADVFFPSIEENDWQKEELTQFEKNEKNEFSGVITRYRKKSR